MLNSAQRIVDRSRPSDDAIEAIIQHAISSRQEVRPMRDTRTQLFVGNLPYRVRWQDLKDLFRKAGTVLRADVSLGPDNRSRGYGTVLLATAEDAGRAVDMFNGYTWQTRVLEVRLDRLTPEYDQGRMGFGTGVGSAAGLGGGPPSIPGATAPYLALGIAGSGSAGGATISAHSGLGSGFAALANSTDAGPIDLSLLPGVPNSTSHFSQNFIPSRPSSSSAAVHDPLDFLHSSTSAAELQSTDPAANRTLLVGNLPFHIQWQDLKDLFRQAGTILRADVALGPDNRSRGFGTVIFATEADAERAVKMFNGYEHHGRVLKVYNDKFPSLTSSTSLPLSSVFLPPTSSYATLITPSSPVQHQYGQHLNPPQRDSGSSSRHSSISSSVAHSATSSPLPGHAVQSPTQSRHGQTHREGYPTLGLHPRFDPAAHSQVHGSATQHHPGHLTLPPGFLYDYGQPSMPTSPHEFYQRQQQEKEYFERVPAIRQPQQDRIRREGGIKEGSIERVGIWQQREYREREPESDILRHLAPAPASTLDIESLTTSLASMDYSSSGGRSHGSATVESSLSPTSISASMSVSVSGSTSNSNSNPGSNPHSTAPSKPPSTKPILGTFMSPHNLPSVSTASLPAHFGTDGLGLEAGLATGTVSVGGSRKASFTSGAGSGAYYQHSHLYPPSMTTRTSATTTTTASSVVSDAGSMTLSMTEDELVGFSSPFMRQDLAQGLGKDRPPSSAPSESRSGRLSRSSRAGSGSGSQVGDGDLTQKNESSERERSGSVSSRGHGQTTQEGQMQKQHPHHPGPIALPPPPSMTFNPMQMPMMMPLSTMTPGHPHGHAPTPHAFPLGNRMNLGMNVSPLYHPAHPGSAAMSAMAAAAMHGGGSPSPFAMYPGPPAMTGAMMSLTPHGLPAITPSMPPFSFFPQQYYTRIGGGVAVKGPGEEGHSREGGGEGGRDGEGAGEGRGNVPSAAAHQMQRSQPLRLNLNAVPAGFSPGVTMSPGTFYGRPGQVPHPNPYINAAVGAPVHPVASPPVHTRPAYPPGFIAGVPPHAAYPYPIPSPMQGDLSGGEPQGYFDHVYFPSALGQDGGGEPVAHASEEAGPSSEKSSGKEPEEAQEDVVSSVSGDARGPEVNQYAPSRTHSVGHTRPSSLRGRGKHRSDSDPLSAPPGIREGVEVVEN